MFDISLRKGLSVWNQGILNGQTGIQTKQSNRNKSNNIKCEAVMNRCGVGKWWYQRQVYGSWREWISGVSNTALKMYIQKITKIIF